MSCHVTSPSSLSDGWLRGWVSADQRPLSRAMRSSLAPDWSVHATKSNKAIVHDLITNTSYEKVVSIKYVVCYLSRCIFLKSTTMPTFWSHSLCQGVSPKQLPKTSEDCWRLNFCTLQHALPGAQNMIEKNNKGPEC